MTDDKTKAQVDAPPAAGDDDDDDDGDGGEAKFWEKLNESVNSAVGVHLSDEKLDGAFGRWTDRMAASLADEEKKSGKAKADPAASGDDGRGSDAGSGDDREPSAAERAREAGRVGRRARSRYYDRIKGWLY